jgi:electron transport complex protein RnfG
MLRYGFTLAIICIVASGLLAGVNVLTKSRITSQAQAEEDSSLKEVFPEAAHFEAVKSGEEIIYYKAQDKEGRMLGAAFRASGKGYSSTIETMAGMFKDGTIKAIKILSQNETPGLGARVAEDSFASRFSNKGLQNLSEVEAITGATISSRAVIDSVKKKAEEIKAMVDSGK